MEGVTYERDGMVESLDEVLDVGKLESGQPSMVVVLNLIVDDHDEADN